MGLILHITVRSRPGTDLTFLFDMSCCCSEENFSKDVKTTIFVENTNFRKRNDYIILALIHFLALIHDFTMIIVQS